MNEFCTIFEQDELRLVGIKVRFDAESRGLGTLGTNTATAAVRKFRANGTLDLLAALCKTPLTDILAARTNITGDGVYDLIVGIPVDSFDCVPPYLPEYTETVVLPAKTYLKMDVNEDNIPDVRGFNEAMVGDEYFIGEFRETGYVFDRTGISYIRYDAEGRTRAICNPIKMPADYAESMDTFVFTPVVLPDIHVACATDREGDEFVIFKYFRLQEQVWALDCAKLYNDDYYGFPVDQVDGKLVSGFGSRVSSFDGLPDEIEGHTVPGGLYLHIWQHEPNGDNPGMCYNAAFEHLDRLYFTEHPEYERDNSRHVVARFRQANHASVFVPLKRKEN